MKLDEVDSGGDLRIGATLASSRDCSLSVDMCGVLEPMRDVEWVQKYLVGLKWITNSKARAHEFFWGRTVYTMHAMTKSIYESNDEY